MNGCVLRPGAAAWVLLAGPVTAVCLAQDRIAGGIAFPADSGVVNVRHYGARGDGVTDDTAAIQAAARDAFEHGGSRYACPAFVHLPNGTYLVSDTIERRVSDEGWSSGWRAGNILFGQSRDKMIIRLRDNAPGFGDPESPKPVIANGSEADGENPQGGGNRAFRNSVLNLTIDVGDGNPGAVVTDWVASNRGTVEDVLLRAGEGSGSVGLLLDRRWPGPCLAKRVTIEGFDYGVTARSHYQYSVTFEHIELRGQRVAGILNQRNVLHMRGLVSRNAAPAIRVDAGHGHLTLIEARLEGGAEDQPAILNHGKLFLRNVSCSAYGVAIEDLSADEPRITAGGDEVSLAEYASHEPVTLFQSRARSLRLPVKETPEFHVRDTEQWASVTSYGATPGASFMNFDVPPAVERIDAAIHFDWGEGAPAEVVGAEQFSVRWTGGDQGARDGHLCLSHGYR